MRLYTICIALVLTIDVAMSQCPNLIWSDEFNGNALDNSKWNIQLGDGCDIGNCGWGNNELQLYSAEAISVSDGFLTITAEKSIDDGISYSSARINTRYKGDWTYGRFEARLQLPKGQGIWPAFWMLSTNEPYGGWPRSGEIDIMELVGHEPNVVHGTLHYGDPWPNNGMTTASYTLPTGDFSDDFHVFAVEWEEAEIRWFIDGQMYSRKTRADLQGKPWPFDQNMHLLLNLAVGGNWPGQPSGSTVFPQEYIIDYVRVYDGFLPYLKGKSIVEAGEENVVYELQNLQESDSITEWLIEGGTFQEDSENNRIYVDFTEDALAQIQAIVLSTCGLDTISLDVVIQPPFNTEFVLENFDQAALIEYSFSTGTFLEEVMNPSLDSVNSSDLVGSYTRNSAEQYDVLFFDTDAIDDASNFSEGEKIFSINIYTDAPAGTPILVQLESKGRATAEYPTGRHSRYQVVTEHQNGWHTLRIPFLDKPDQNQSPLTVDQLVILFAPNSFSSHTWYFDDFQVLSQDQIVPVKEFSGLKYAISLRPNPANDTIQFTADNATEIMEMQILDTTGKQIRLVSREEIRSGELAISLLPEGLYHLSVQWNDNTQQNLKFFKGNN